MTRFPGFEAMAWLPDQWVVAGIAGAAGLGVLAAAFAVWRELGKAYAV
jgi:hypothetical protein